MAIERQSRADLRARADQRGAAAAIVRARRLDLGLRQEEVADLAGCSTRFIHELEVGKSTVQLAKVIDVLAVLGLHLSIGDGAATDVLIDGGVLREYGLE